MGTGGGNVFGAAARGSHARPARSPVGAVRAKARRAGLPSRARPVRKGQGGGAGGLVEPGAGCGSPAALVRECRLSEADAAFLEQVAGANHMSGRAIMRVLRVARTVADMDESPAVAKRHLCEAVGLPPAGRGDTGNPRPVRRGAMASGTLRRPVRRGGGQGAEWTLPARLRRTAPQCPG